MMEFNRICGLNILDIMRRYWTSEKIRRAFENLANDKEISDLVNLGKSTNILGEKVVML